MAHMLDQNRNGKYAMAYVGEAGWHGLGQRLTADATLEEWQKEAGMDWTIAESDLLYAPMNSGKLRAFKGKKVLSRSDTGSALSVVAQTYNVVQPATIVEFFRDLIADQGFKLDTMGVLYRGRKFWALARVGKDIRLMGNDVVSPYLLLATSCDGSMATCADPTSVRVVCQNTLRMAIGDTGKLSRIQVHHGLEFNADAVKEELGLANIQETIDGFVTTMSKLAKTKVAVSDAIDIIAAQLKEEWKTTEGETMNQQQMMDTSRTLRRIIKLFEGEAKGADFKSSTGTAWGLVNAVTEHFDHEVGANNADNSRSFERAHLSDRAKFKVKVAESLLAIAA